MTVLLYTTIRLAYPQGAISEIAAERLCDEILDVPRRQVGVGLGGLVGAIQTVPDMLRYSKQNVPYHC